MLPSVPPGCDVAPRFLPRQARHLRELADDLSLHLVGVAPKVAFVERVADVVDRVLHEGQQRRVVEVMVARIAGLLSVQRLEVVPQGVEAPQCFCVRLVHVGLAFSETLPQPSFPRRREPRDAVSQLRNDACPPLPSPARGVTQRSPQAGIKGWDSELGNPGISTPPVSHTRVTQRSLLSGYRINLSSTPASTRSHA